MIGLQKIADRFRGALRRLPTASQAAAGVEFALIVPFLITLYMGTIELSDLIAVDRRITVVAGTTGDLVARTDGNLPTATMDDYFQAAAGIIMPYSNTGLKQVVTCVFVNTAGVTSIAWSRAYNGGTAKTVGQPYPLPTAMTDISRNTWVIVAETYYAYKPLLGWVIKSAINLHRTSFYLPRYGQYIALT